MAAHPRPGRRGADQREGELMACETCNDNFIRGVENWRCPKHVNGGHELPYAIVIIGEMLDNGFSDEEILKRFPSCRITRSPLINVKAN